MNLQLGLPNRVVKALNQPRCSECVEPCGNHQDAPLDCELLAAKELRKRHLDFAAFSTYELNRMLVQFADETGLAEK